MRFQGKLFLMAILLGGFAGRAQQVSQTATPTVIRTETRLVLVDAVVTDKKGNYIPDLAQKEFKVYEDNKEQPLTSFSYEADPSSPNSNQKRYLILFFDNASVAAGDQIKARDAAQKFVDANTGPNKFIAVVNFSGTLKISQNFTNDADRLKAVISGVKTSSVTTDDGATSTRAGMPSLSQAATFGVSSVLLGMRSLAKGLANVPGRKMLVMLTAGFLLTDDTRPELTATIAACNRSNVSIYPIDVRGLSSNPGLMPGNTPGLPGGRGGRAPMALLNPLQIFSSPRLASFANSFQARGGGGTGTGTGTGAGTSTGAGAGGTTGAGAGAGAAAGGGRGAAPVGGTNVGAGGTRGAPTTTNNGPASGGRGPNNNPGGLNGGRNGGMNPNPPLNPAMNRNPMDPMNPSTIMPTIPRNADSNLDALYMLAEGTGGFVIHNTNDLLGGMEKIAREQNQYYILGFTPSASADGSCHTLRVKVDKGGTNVRSRSGYCNVRSTDPLAGKPVETELESLAVGQSKGRLGSPLQLPFFYTAANVARINVAMEVPSDAFKFDKVKGKFHSEMNLLGIAYRPDGSVGAKFSDTLKFDFDNKTQLEEFSKKPVHYENQFDIATGEYNVKVVFSTGGENFGKIEKPLKIEPFDGKQFAVSSLALAKELLLTKDDLGMDAVLIEDRVPLVSRGFQAVPAAQYAFKQSDSPGMYLEIYDSSLAEDKPPSLSLALQIVDKKTNQQKMASPSVQLEKYVRPGNPMVPVILYLPVKDLPPGSYRVDIMGMNSAGKSMERTTDFDVEPATTPVLGWDKK